MSKLNLDSIPSLVAAPGVIDSNNQRVVQEFDKVLYRDGTAPNGMLSNLDMNGYRVTNLPLPLTNAEPVRLAEFKPLEAKASLMDAQVAAAAASAQNAQNSANAAESFLNQLTSRITVSTEDPSGGNDGDIWFKVV